MATLLTDPRDFWVVLTFKQQVLQIHAILIVSLEVTVGWINSVDERVEF